jgi:hypothetical protein
MTNRPQRLDAFLPLMPRKASILSRHIGGLPPERGLLRFRDGFRKCHLPPEGATAYRTFVDLERIAGRVPYAVLPEGRAPRGRAIEKVFDVCVVAVAFCRMKSLVTRDVCWAIKNQTLLPRRASLLRNWRRRRLSVPTTVWALLRRGRYASSRQPRWREAVARQTMRIRLKQTRNRRRSYRLRDWARKTT